MEVRTHGMENFNMNKEPDKLSMNLNPEIQEFWGHTSNPIATITDFTPPVDVTQTPAVINDVISNTRADSNDATTYTSDAQCIDPDSFTFPSATNDLNIPLPETQDPYASSVVDQQPEALPSAFADGQPTVVAVATEEVETFQVGTEESLIIPSAGGEPQLATPQDPCNTSVVDKKPATFPGAFVDEQPTVVSVAAGETETFQVLMQESPMEHPPFDDMVIVKDGMVTIEAPDVVPSVEEEFQVPNDVIEEYGEAIAEELPSADVTSQQVKEVEDPRVMKAIEVPTEVLLEGSFQTVAQILDEGQQGPPAFSGNIQEPPCASPTHKFTQVAEEGTLGVDQPVHAGDVQEPTSASPIEKISEHIQAEQTELAHGLQAEMSEQDVEAIKGRKVLKRFGKKEFAGEVVGFDPESKWFKIVYDDGDEEELEKVEVEAILLAPGSLPASAPRKRAHSGALVQGGSKRSSKKAKVVEAGTSQKRGRPLGLKKGIPLQVQKNAKLPGSKKVVKSPSSGTKSVGTKGKAGFKKMTSAKKHLNTSGKQLPQSTATKKQTVPKGRSQKGQKSEQDVSSVQEIVQQESPIKGEKTPRKSPRKGRRKEKAKAVGSSNSRKGVSAKSSKIAQKPRGQEPVTPRKGKPELEELKLDQETALKESGQKKKSIKGKMPKTTRAGRGPLKGQVEGTSQKLKAGVKRKADFEEDGEPQGKQSKKVAVKHPKSPTGAGIGRTMRSKVAVEVKEEDLEGRIHSDQKGSEPEGVALVGRTIRKEFGGIFYSGEVVGYDKKLKFYKVKYEDGDQEDLEWRELQPTLLMEEKINVGIKSQYGKKPPSSRVVAQKNRAGTSKKRRII